MDNKTLIDILKVIFVLGFILLPQVIKFLAKSKKSEGFTPSRKPDTQRNKFKTTQRINRKPVASYQEKPKPPKKVDDILAEIFGDKPSPLTPERKSLPSKTHEQEKHQNGYHGLKKEKNELPRFKTNIRKFKVNSPSLPDDIKGFKSDIPNVTEIPEQTSPLLKKLKRINHSDLRYGIVISEILGPPVSLK